MLDSATFLSISQIFSFVFALLHSPNWCDIFLLKLENPRFERTYEGGGTIKVKRHREKRVIIATKDKDFLKANVYLYFSRY